MQANLSSQKLVLQVVHGRSYPALICPSIGFVESDCHIIALAVEVFC
jgi:hypothetical protein